MEVFHGDRRNEEDLIQAAAGGDPAAFEDLFHRYYDMIHAYAYRLGGDAAEAADIAQETWIRVARGLPRYERKASFKNWVYAVAHNVVLDAGRRKARVEKLHEHVRNESAGEASPPPADESEAVRDALLTLPSGQRAAVTLVYLEGMSHAEAAKVLRCAEATVSWRLFQARRKLKKLLSREDAP